MTKASKDKTVSESAQGRMSVAHLQRVQQRYVDNILKTFEEHRDELSVEEARLAEKCIRGEHRIQVILRDIETLKNQVTQAQARIRSMELTLESEQGRINGFVELLVDGMPPEGDLSPQPPEDPPPDIADPPPVNRKQRRARAKTKAKAKS